MLLRVGLDVAPRNCSRLRRALGAEGAGLLAGTAEGAPLEAGCDAVVPVRCGIAGSRRQETERIDVAVRIGCQTIPRWTYGPSTSGVPLGPTVPIASCSATVAPLETAIEPRCVSVTE